MKNVVVIDYGMGNLLSVRRAFEFCGAHVEITSVPGRVERAEYLVLPGVGAFADGMSELESRDLVKAVRRFAKTGRPFMGICLGMQMMMEAGEEFGIHKGLALIPGTVSMIAKEGPDGSSHKIPHIGWNGLFPPHDNGRWDNTILHGISPGESAYFVHSFSAVPAHPDNDLAGCFYNGLWLCAVLKSGNIYGCQFHPEKSSSVGLRIIDNFLKIQPIRQ